MSNSNLIAGNIIVSKIFTIRGVKVMLDNDLAELYSVQTKVLNQSVKRNLKRFPADFMFKLTDEEVNTLRSQFVTSNGLYEGSNRGGRRTLPHAFTEQGIAMLSAVLNSDTAIDVNIQIIRTFSKIREIASINGEILLKLEKMESRLTQNQMKAREQEEEIALIFNYLKQLMKPKPASRERIGFKQKTG